LLGGKYEAFDYCTVVETCGAEVLGTYCSDFYQGQPAVTRNNYGAGTAYFIGARTDGVFLGDFYKQLIPPGCTPPIQCDAGVSIQTRESDTCRYHFVMNFTEEERSITLESPMVDIITGESQEKCKHVMQPYGVHIYKVPKRTRD
jgi:beta-galactosidase